MKIKTQDLIGPALDWAVAKCEGAENIRENPHRFDKRLIMTIANRPVHFDIFRFSTDWAQGGPIIEREWIKVSPYHNQGGWWAEHAITKSVFDGPTPLIAAMRCFCCTKLGDEIEIPEELK